MQNEFQKMKLKHRQLKNIRFKNFSNKWYKRIRNKYYIQYIKEQCCYIIKTNDDIFRYFPKSNKVLVDSSREWKRPGLQYLKDILFPNFSKKNKNNFVSKKKYLEIKN